MAVICELRRGLNEKGVGLLRGSFKEDFYENRPCQYSNYVLVSF